MTDILERLRREHALLSRDGRPTLIGNAADEIERLREALERVSTSNNLPFIWEISRKALEPEP